MRDLRLGVAPMPDDRAMVADGVKMSVRSDAARAGAAQNCLCHRLEVTAGGL